MGLDLYSRDGEKHAGCAYSSFNRFREKLALEININLKEMSGYESLSETPTGLNWDTVTDDLKILFNHSDCDGKLTARECKLIYPRVRDLTKDWNEEYRDFRYFLSDFLELLEYCSENKMGIRFS